MSSYRYPSETGAYSFTVGYSRSFIDEIENESGWTAGVADDNATTGMWERADPQATGIGSQPEDDHTEQGTDCYITGALAGQGDGSFDVDNGKTTLLSPVYDLSGLQDPVITYFKWYSNDRGATPGTDFWVVHASNDGGASWVEIENTNQSSAGWEKVLIRLADYVAPTAQVQFRFVASDEGAGSLVEAGVDDFEVLTLGQVTGIADGSVNATLPDAFLLEQNYPNPFNPATRIAFALPQNADVSLGIYNLLGQEIRRLVHDNRAAGVHVVEWDGRNGSGAAVASGVYLYRLQAAGFGHRALHPNPYVDADEINAVALLRQTVHSRTFATAGRPGMQHIRCFGEKGCFCRHPPPIFSGFLKTNLRP